MVSDMPTKDVQVHAGDSITVQALRADGTCYRGVHKLALERLLVPQDPNDEPAGVLLERIKAERQNQGKDVGRHEQQVLAEPFG